METRNFSLKDDMEGGDTFEIWRGRNAHFLFLD